MVEEGLLVNLLDGRHSSGGQWQADIFFPHPYPSLVSEWFTMGIHFLRNCKSKKRPPFPAVHSEREKGRSVLADNLLILNNLQARPRNVLYGSASAGLGGLE